MTEYTSVIHCHSTVIESCMIRVWGGGGKESVRGDYTGIGYIFHGSDFFFHGSDNIKGQAVISHELKHMKSREGLLKLEHFENT